MAVRSVVIFPDPILKMPVPKAQRLDESALRICQDLVDTMRAHDRCVGLAAPQIREGIRALVVDVSEHPKAEASHGLLVLVNPQILAQEGSEIGREGCLSLPEITANVRRSRRILFEGMCPDGSVLRSFSAGFEARALQHEIDHLNGLLILDKVSSSTEIFDRQ